MSLSASILLGMLGVATAMANTNQDNITGTLEAERARYESMMPVRPLDPPKAAPLRPNETLSLEGWIQLMIDLDYWNPRISEAEFLERLSLWDDQHGYLTEASAARPVAASPFSQSLPG